MSRKYRQTESTQKSWNSDWFTVYWCVCISSHLLTFNTYFFVVGKSITRIWEHKKRNGYRRWAKQKKRTSSDLRFVIHLFILCANFSIITATGTAPINKEELSLKYLWGDVITDFRLIYIRRPKSFCIWSCPPFCSNFSQIIRKANRFMGFQSKF